MERRKLLQMLGFTPTLALSLQGIKLHETKDTQYKGWTIKWSDWIPCMNQHLLVGRWVAMKEGESIGVYSSVPGACGWFLPGQMFDISIHEGQMFITPEITVVAAEKQKEMGLIRLLKFLDNPDPLPRYWR